MKRLVSGRTYLLAILLLAVPSVASASVPHTFSDLAALIVQMLDNATAVLIAGAIVVYFFGISSNIMKLHKGESSEMRSYLIWGLAVIFVMVSIWGILQLLQNTLFGGGGYTGNATVTGQTCNSFGSCNFGSP